MILYPNAKINIGLYVINKRADGYHNIETVFYPIPLCDSLEITRAQVSDYTFEQQGLQLDALPEDNLILKTYRLMQKQFGISGIHISFEKNIPFGAGLGGGSADAAFTIKALNELFDLQLTPTQMEHIIAPLGADCPFFIKNKPVFAQGIGNEFTPTTLCLAGYYLVLVKPNIHVSTPDAYAGVVPCQANVNLVDFVANTTPEEWSGVVRNDFETSVFKKYPAIAAIKEELYKAGAVYASMSGSGSTVFGLFAQQVNLPAFPNCFVYQQKINA